MFDQTHDQEVTRLIKQNMFRSRDITHLDISVISDIETVLNHGKYSSSNSAGLLIIRYSNGKITSEAGDGLLLPADRDKVLDWFSLREEDKKPFVSDMYRIDLISSIFIFKEYLNREELVIAGHLLVRSRMVRMDLLDIEQEDIRRRLCHHQREAI